MQRRSTRAMAAMVLVFTVTAGACGGSSTPKPAKHASGTTANGGAVDPNAPEIVAPGDIPDRQAFITYSTAGYSIKVPEGWSQSINGATTTFTDHYNTVTATSASARTAPSVAGVHTSEVSQLRQDVPNFQLVNVASVNRTAGPVVLVTYRAGSTPDPVTGKRVAIDVERYEFWHNGTQVTLTLSGARGSDNVDPWKTITNSFAWTA